MEFVAKIAPPPEGWESISWYVNPNSAAVFIAACVMVIEAKGYRAKGFLLFHPVDGTYGAQIQHATPGGMREYINAVTLELQDTPERSKIGREVSTFLNELRNEVLDEAKRIISEDRVHVVNL